jgi:hypothetical protein
MKAVLVDHRRALLAEFHRAGGVMAHDDGVGMHGVERERYPHPEYPAAMVPNHRAGRQGLTNPQRRDRRRPAPTGTAATFPG